MHSLTTLAFLVTALIVTGVGLLCGEPGVAVSGAVSAAGLGGLLLVIRAGHPHLASALARLLIVLVASTAVAVSGRIDAAPLVFSVALAHAAATATVSATLSLSVLVGAVMTSWYWLLSPAAAGAESAAEITLHLVLVALVVAGALAGVRMRERGVDLLGQSRHQAAVLSASLSEANAQLASVYADLARVNADLEARVETRTRDLERSLDKQRALVRELGELAQRDALTGLWNRRALEHELWQPELQHRPHCLLIADLDHFKVVNDTFGHLAGDAALRAVAGVLTANVRENDTISRIGGEEFAVLLPATDLELAQLVAERLRRAVQHLRVPELGDYQLTISLGLAACGGSACTMHLNGGDHREMLLHSADLALYQAKARGRNRVELPA